ncbi:MAG: PTS sugar transporter subunit IIA [Ignavibacteriota bacterium]|jgi:fructose-specific phosphotransferase system IIA component|nr:MAG: PTS sugar transporter subunit IIA [Chlorobiota bacterium]MBE7476906.1 PTS sugar transporter subunit IIA [Ignavibacteriales bacterium]MBL1121843.1 PTS sugar transporter subunit IIA [Ignavibacteriota bacterium]MCC7093816.1 PTS sugar transporter subunit IIA [Ignavibacteriaceae bacterium]MEB2297602.1 PTS sugar transporter subunit IIA [Ignavibacteria bacterium]
MKVHELLSTGNILTNFKSVHKDDVINELIDLLNADSRVTDLEEIRKCVFEREEKMSTGVGKGFAIPHGKTNSVTDIIAAFGKSETPIEYDSLDGEPVHLIFLLIGKETLLAKHIKLLSRISRLMNNEEFRKKLIDADSPESILKIFHDEEQSYSDV